MIFDPCKRFDFSAFIDDVHLYRRRHCPQVQTMARQAGLDPSYLRRILAKQTTPTLLAVLALADWADLSVDKYRLVPA